MNTNATSLPSKWGSQELRVLLLQGNPLKKIPEAFFQEFNELRYVNLGNCQITSLSLSLLLSKSSIHSS